MGAVSTHAAPLSGSKSYEQLEKRLQREIAARKSAECLLKDKSKSLIASNQALEKVAHHLEEQRQQLDIILDNTVGGIFLTNANFHILRVNKAGMEIFNLCQETLLDLKIIDLFHADLDVPHVVRQAQKELGQARIYETVGITIYGDQVPIEIGVTLVKQDAPRSKQYVWIVRNITRRKQDDAKREVLEKELAQAQKLEALGTLASGVAHEINTPIQYVGDNLRFLQDSFTDLIALMRLQDSKYSDAELEAKKEEIDLEFLEAELPASLEQSLYGLDQVARIVKAVKEFSHPGSGDAESINLNELASSSSTLCKNQWKYLADVEFLFDPNLPEVVCYPGDVNQVLLNMIVNAADAIDELGAGDKGTITLQTRFDDTSIYLDISDTGCGMDESVVGRIFDPFFTTKDVGKGTGQGLAISYNIIKQKHGGDIKVVSSEGAGTTFTISLPREFGGVS